MKRKARHNIHEPRLGVRRGSVGRATKVHVGQVKKRGRRKQRAKK